MAVSTVVLVLVAAVLHAWWNALIKIEGDRLLAAALIAFSSGVMAAGALPFVPLPLPESRPYIAAAVVLYLGYWLFLIQAYEYGDLGHVYPIARGVAPLIIVAVTLIFLGEHLVPGQIVAIVVIAAGIGSLAFAGDKPVHGDPRPLLYALGTGLFIAAYSIVDALGARLAGNPHSYVLWAMALDGIPITLIALAKRRQAALVLARARWKLGVLGGALCLSSYWLVVWAFTLGPIAPVAALRETSVIFAAIFGTVFLKERLGRARIAAVVAVALGIVLLKV